MKLADLTIGNSYAFGSRDRSGKIIRSNNGVFIGVGSHRGVTKAKFETLDTWFTKALGEPRTRIELVTPQQILGTVEEIEEEQKAEQEALRQRVRAMDAREALKREQREEAFEVRQQEKTRLEALLNGYRVEFNGSWVITLPEGANALSDLLDRLEA